MQRSMVRVHPNPPFIKYMDLQRLNLNYVIARLQKMNFNLIIIVLLIFSCSLFTLYSAGGGFFPFFIRQLIFFVLSIFVVIFFVVIDFNIIKKYSYHLYGLSILLLIYVDFFVHTRTMGAIRWIKIFGFSVQPSELAKIGLFLSLGKYFENKTMDEIFKTKTLLIPTCLTILPLVLILKQPDLGTAVIFCSVLVLTFFLIGVQWWKFAICGVLFLSSLPFVWKYGLHQYQRERVEVFLGIIQDKRGKEYNKEQALIAIGNGGLWGTGYLKGSQNQNSFVPEKQTDFIFSIFIEENGFVFGLILILLYFLLSIFILFLSITSKKIYNKIIMFNVSFIFFIHSFINMGMVMGLLPIVGIPLEFVSLGGTITLLSFIMLAFVLNLEANELH
ncbi:MAG: rod shape-determining protein RodA [Rickettsiales bacterium]|nr:MAG: rod shape-determining protein RodA [Rickettsiales bacterium]